MALQIALSKDSIKNLKCSSCQKYLSTAPIHMSKDKYTCGRCKPSGERVHIYEQLAKYMVFPCSYDACKIQILWGQVENHEKLCSNRSVLCPFYNCEMTCYLKRLMSHFQTEHMESICMNELTVKRKLRDMPVANFCTDRKTYMLIHDKLPYIMMVYGKCLPKKNNKKLIGCYSFHFGMFSLHKQTKFYELSVEINSGDGTLTNYVWENQEIREYDDTVYCLHCIQGNCDIWQHTKNKGDFLWNKLDNIQTKPNLTLTYSVKFLDERSKKAVKHINALKESPARKSDLASKLTCPVCYEYMCIPIYICPKGHSLCKDCHRDLMICTFCQSDLGSARNFTLEEVAESVYIPCSNAAKGCSYTGIVRSTKQHMLTCTYGLP